MAAASACSAMGKAVRVAGKAEPPIVVVWTQDASRTSKPIRHIIKLKRASIILGVDVLFRALLARYPAYFGAARASDALRRVLDAIVAEAPSASQATAYRSDAAGCGDAGPSLPSASGTATSTSPEAARTGPARVAAAASSMTGEASSPGKRALLAVSQQFGDLQTADPEAVEAAKHKMSEGYEAHRLRPGDSGYEYDKRVDFGAPMEDNEWDDEDEDEYF